MFALLLPFVLGDPTPIASPIQDVTLYGSSALVRRAADLPRGGSFVVQGLPEAIDRENVRVRCQGGDVVDVEVRERVVDRVPSGRVQELRDRLQALQREMEVLHDARSVLEAMDAHIRELMKLSASDQRRDVQAGKASVEAWGASWQFVSERLSESSAAMREARWKVEGKQKELEAVELELGRFQNAGSVTVNDVLVEVVAPGRASLDVEYIVGSTGWQPAYDLRATRDLSKVELSYRARVWQQTGEDWKDVELVLSTAKPQMGAQGPEPQPVWLSVWEPQPTGGIARRAPPAAEAPDEKQLRGMGYADKGEAEPAPRPFASVESQGLSVHFRLAQKETIESREQPTTVLVGTADLSIAPERMCVPALDPTVWLRAKTKNTSPWVLLPGTAGVFFGADYLGPAQIDTVQPSQDLTLHLGADPGITCERTRTQDLSKGPGFLSSRSSRIEGWRMHFENHGTVGAAPDGSAEVIVQDVLPKSRDERIEVEISKAEPKPSEDERWKKDREEKGILTWIVRVPRGEQGADMLFETEITFPKGAKVVRE